MSVTVLHVRDSATLVFVYRRRKTDGTYYAAASDYGSTPPTIAVHDTEETNGAALLAATPMTFVAAIDGWRYVWNYGAALNGKRAITHRVVVTDATKRSVLIPNVTDEYHLSDVEELVDEHELARASMQTALQGEHDATQQQLADARTAIQSDIAAHEALSAGRHTAAVAEHDATQAAVAAARTSIENLLGALDAALDAHEAARAAMQTTLQSEHDATQAALAAARTSIEALLADLDADLVAHEGARAAMQTAFQGEHDATQADVLAARSSIEAAISALDVALAAHETARASMQSAFQAEHDGTQAALAAARSSIEALVAAVGADVATHDAASASRHAGTQAAVAAARTSIEGTGYDPATDSLRALRDENLAEHNDTQGRIEALDLRQSVLFIVPARLVPGATHNVWLRIRDDNGAYVDPDGGVLPSMNVLGALPPGVTLGGWGYEGTGTTGRFRGTVTVALGTTNQALPIVASWQQGGAQKEEVRVTTISDEEADHAQLAADVAALAARASEDRLGKLDRDLAEKNDVTAARDAVKAEVDALEEEVGTSADGPDAPTVHGRLRALADEHADSDGITYERHSG